mmetsp:Transcript_39466/g.95487  ORF Transcript_39466/g.95487 Transcript_39466/m.95487 type:complete len:184 (+) Transcript_39466:163-714(+)|eukprot:CAMPEP_0113626220 /NCGR_PEP_ID=MMETSP0017_2-20120614/13560_1 /TAXON_ID=2856 /ORGANISM="Cylindrotheca closterium" /LENGTH=183 /DNA_ID=CAMNT_0000536393 /DNA_START=163 /DNA_END=714 /DNA_ORIENTATION=- /assembly_acc=CAM_ASM_000147
MTIKEPISAATTSTTAEVLASMNTTESTKIDDTTMTAAAAEDFQVQDLPLMGKWKLVSSETGTPFIKFKSATITYSPGDTPNQIMAENELNMVLCCCFPSTVKPNHRMEMKSSTEFTVVPILPMDPSKTMVGTISNNGLEYVTQGNGQELRTQFQGKNKFETKVLNSQPGAPPEITMMYERFY